MKSDDTRMVELAVKLGFITEEQVAVCVRAQEEWDAEATRGRKSPRPIGVMLVEKKFLTDRQLIQLKDELHTEQLPPTPKKIGEILVDRGVTTVERIEESVREQERIARSGKKTRIGEILLAKGHTSMDELVEALKEQGKTLVSCIACQMRFNVVGYKPWIEFRCRKCGSLLQPVRGARRAGSAGTVAARVSESAPDEVQQAARNPNANFGNFVLLREIVRGDFGALHRAWDKIEDRYVGLAVLDEKSSSDKLTEVFSRVQRSAREVGVKAGYMLDAGQAGGRRYLTVSLS